MTFKPFAVTVHPFTSPTHSACAYERGDTTSRNAIVYLGGLTCGPHTTPELETLVEALQTNPELSYSFWEFRMRSSYTGFGYSSLGNDVEDVSALVKYLREQDKENIVLLGSSTGKLYAPCTSGMSLTVCRMPRHPRVHRFQTRLSGSRCVCPASTYLGSRNSRVTHAV
jgi:hypothetical protein